MPRTLHDPRLDTRSARARLARRAEPYWRKLSEGMAVGYRKGAKGGTWVAKYYSPEHGRRFRALGAADDVLDANGITVLSFTHAQEAAGQWFEELTRQDAGEVLRGAYTVDDAMTDYLADYRRRSGKATDRIQYVVDAHMSPSLGKVELSKLTRRKIETWLDGLASAAARVRTKRGQDQRYRVVEDDPEYVRGRRATANRILTILKAALNLAYQNRRVSSPQAWAAVRPFREADAPKVRYLSEEEARALIAAAPPDLRAMILAALFTGARYGELARLAVSDFDPVAGTIHIRRTKSGSPRHVPLPDRGVAFFERATAGKSGQETIFIRSTGAVWKHADQVRPMREACLAAGIDPPIGFHVLRHTYGSRMAMQGVPMTVIAKALGHADTRMTERHYAHLAPSYVADTIRTAFQSIDIVEPVGTKVPELET